MRRSRPRAFALGFVLALGLLLGACGRSQGPSQTLDRYGRALKNRDYATAYELMSSSFRGKVSREDVHRRNAVFTFPNARLVKVPL